uniref:C2H2-type domain-containing protein n=1 Tax=Panagrolaimus sp. ES5 TaxID=591445 RepID=A0AC34FCZ9_9BILA
MVNGPTTRGKYNKSPSKRTPLKQQTQMAQMPQLNGPYKNNIQIDLPPIPAAIRPRHKRKHSDSSSLQQSSSRDEEDDEKVHECKHCPFTCLDSKMLKFHTRMHDGERPQKCAMCTFSCFNIDALYSHMNVHAPQLPENMLIMLKKKVAQRRRNGSLMERETISPNATNNYCTQCSFRCDTVVALMNHQEYHGSRNNLFKCRYCDYSANSHDVVTYHENTHHMDLPATNQSLNFSAINGINDTDEVSEKRQKYKCTRCLYICHELSDYISHFEKQHIGEPEFEEIIQKLKMGLLPTLPIRANIISQQTCHATIAQEQQHGSPIATIALSEATL